MCGFALCWACATLGPGGRTRVTANQNVQAVKSITYEEIFGFVSLLAADVLYFSP